MTLCVVNIEIYLGVPPYKESWYKWRNCQTPTLADWIHCNLYDRGEDTLQQSRVWSPEHFASQHRPDNSRQNKTLCSAYDLPTEETLSGFSWQLCRSWLLICRHILTSDVWFYYARRGGAVFICSFRQLIYSTRMQHKEQKKNADAWRITRR